MAELVLQAPKGIQTRGTLLDLLDRVLGKGVVAYGDIVLSIADLDLVYLNLRAVLSSIGTLERLEETERNDKSAKMPIAGGANDSTPNRHSEPRRGEESNHDEILRRPLGLPQDDGMFFSDKRAESSTNISRATHDYVQPPFFTEAPIEPDGSKPGKLKLDPQKTAQGLAKLAMTLINLLRKLMERQAIRRMEVGALTPEQLERAGRAFQRLDDQIKELCDQFGLKEEDLNLDLGPLGKLV